MLDWLTNTVTALGAWLTDHPAGMAWIMGWVMALAVAQTAKALLIPVSWSGDAAGRIVQIVATVSGGAAAFVLWPPSDHKFLLALIVGMSAPTAYTFFRAVIEARFPDIAHALSWEGLQESRGDDPPHHHED